jgi:ribosomal protein S9
VNQANLVTFFENIPLLILGGCIFIAGATVLVVVWLTLQSARVRSHINCLAHALHFDGEPTPAVRRDGLRLARLDELRRRCSGMNGPAAEWWRQIEAATEAYTGPEEREGWFITDRAPNLLSYNTVIGRNFSSGFFGAVPGLLTGVGLSLTFTAILIALKDVIVPDDPAGPILGIRPLINGLSGKFLSSIVALALSIFFTVYEKGQVNRLRRAYEHLVDTVESAIPYLSTSRILVDHQRLAAHRTVDRHIEAFNTKVTPELVAAMSSAVAEKMQTERMASAIESLQTIIMEPRKQDSTTDHIMFGKEQREGLADRMNGLLLKLQESADQNLLSVRSQMSMVVEDLSEKVGALSRDMMAAAGNAAKQSQATANQVIEQTGNWSDATAKRLDTLMASMEARTTDFHKASEGLLQARTFVVDVINQNANALDRMAEASLRVQVYSSGLAGQAEALKAITANQSAVVNQFREVSESVRASFEQNETLLSEHRKMFQSYKSVIDDLDGNLGKILTALHGGLTDYNRSMENNFSAIVKISSEMVPDISKFLANQMTALGDQFEELGSVISHSLERIDGRNNQS